MRQVVHLNVHDVTPTRLEVLEAQGMGGRQNIPAKIETLIVSAIEIFTKLAEPKGVLQDVSLSEFQAIYPGEGLNAPDGPVPLIAPGAKALALFAATMGEALAAKSSEMFAQGGPALGFMVDAVNSAGAEKLGRMMCRRFLALLPEALQSKGLKAQYYSPGHCGWHISGQGTLFEALHPEGIGITINSRWVMHPAKSISGVLVAGDMDIHRFKPAFSFCKDCRTHTCVQRLAILESDA